MPKGRRVKIMKAIRRPDIVHDENYEKAEESLRKIIEGLKLTTEEKEGLSQELEAIEEMREKLENGTITITAFGEVATGKSALLNALLGEEVFGVGAEAGTTRSIAKKEYSTGRLLKEEWRTDSVLNNGTAEQLSIRGFESSKIELVDTPGINEVDGEERARMAKDRASRSDLVLFLTDSDINDLEFQSLKELANELKPMILVFNKIDNYTREQKERLLKVIRDERVPKIIKKEDIVMTAADPMERTIITVGLDGLETEELQKPKPMVDDLKMKILEVLEREGKSLIAVNALMFTSGITDKISAKKIQIRQKAADKVVHTYAVIKGVAVAVNPIPIADIIGGMVTDWIMVQNIGKVYGISMTKMGSDKLIKEMVKAAGILGAAEFVTLVTASALKSIIGPVTLGLGILVVGVPQGAVAAYASIVIGKAAIIYFRNGASWGKGGPKRTIMEIIKSLDKESLFKELINEMRKKLKVSRYATGS